MFEQFYYLLYTTLLANCPVDSGNMLSNIVLEDFGDYWKIIISGPQELNSGEFHDYARDVNYNQQRTAKEARNYMWIERTIKQVAEIMGGEVRYELS